MGRYLKIKNKKGVDLQHLKICIYFNTSSIEMHLLLCVFCSHHDYRVEVWSCLQAAAGTVL